MRTDTIRKLKKSNRKDLFCWTSACQLPRVNKEKVAIIEYALGVLVSLEHDTDSEKCPPSRKIMERFMQEARTDIERVIEDLSNSQLLFSFSLGFLTTRGEAFPWQFAQAAIDRYSPHDDWMLRNLGFTISDAVEFSKMIMKRHMMKHLASFPPTFRDFTREEYYDPRYIFLPPRSSAVFWDSTYTFSESELKSLFPVGQHDRLSRYLSRLSVELGMGYSSPLTPTQHNVLTGRPFVRMNDKFLLPMPRLLWRALSTTFHYDLVKDDVYKGKYIDTKGKVAESRTVNCFSKIFKKDKLFSRFKYSKHQGWPDLDLLITEDDVTLLVECTAKWVSQDSKKGDLQSITNDLKTSIEKCSKQLQRAWQACEDGQIKIARTKRILPIVVVDEFIPGLERILKVYDFLGNFRPTIINIYDLDILTDLINGKEFIDFVSKRIDLSKRGCIFAVDEIDYFVMYKTRGFEPYATMLEKKGSELHYIGHLENLFPTYYGEKFRIFLNDPALENIIGIEPLELAEGWS